MIQIFAHRAILNSKENSLEGIRNCIDNNFSVELDLRYDGFVYMFHEKGISKTPFEKACTIIKNSQSNIALHIKEINAIPHVIELIKKFSIENNCFLFMDDYEYTQFRSMVTSDIKVAYYVEKKPNYVDAKIFWCDESKEKWYSEKIISELHLKNKFLTAMSPELLSTSDFKTIKQEWKRIIELGIDGICTDFPEKLLEFTKKRSFD